MSTTRDRQALQRTMKAIIAKSKQSSAKAAYEPQPALPGMEKRAPARAPIEVMPLPERIADLVYAVPAQKRLDDVVLQDEVFAVALASGKSGKSAHFPFGDNAVEVQRRHKGGGKDIPPEIFAVMVSFMPYRTGNVPLWAMNKLANAIKHETLLTPVLAAENLIFEADGMRLETGYRATESSEILVCWLDEGRPNPTERLQVEVSIRFNDIDGVRLPGHAIRLLDTMAEVATQIVDQVEIRARALAIF